MKSLFPRTVTGFLIAAAAGYITIELLDWSRLFHFSTTGTTQEYFASRLIKLLLSFTTGLMVWVTGKAALEKKDRIRLAAAFIFVFAAEIAFFMKSSMFGIILFTITQLILIIRHGTGIVKYLTGPQAKSHLIKFLSSIGAAFALTGLVVLRLFAQHSDNPLFPLILAYAVILASSLGMGISTRFISYFPQKNSLFITAGACALFACDVTVGLNIVLQPSKAYIVSTSLTWLFYLPALTLFALSGYRWEKNG